MKWKFLVFMVLAAMFLAVGTGTALANCGSVTFSITPNSGPAGTSVNASGDGAMSDDSYSIYWDTVSGQPLYSGTTDNGGGFQATVTVPANATPGAHSIIFSGLDYSEDTVECPQTFTVTGATGNETVQQDAYTQARTTMPETGAFLLPAGLLAAAGTGLLLARRRNRP